MMKNNKGMEMAIGTVATIALVLIVLIVVAGYFLGGFKESGGGLTDISGQAGGEAGGFDIIGNIDSAVAIKTCTGGVIPCSSFCDPDRATGGTCTSGVTVSTCGYVGCEIPSAVAGDGVCTEDTDGTICSNIRRKTICTQTPGCAWEL